MSKNNEHGRGEEGEREGGGDTHTQREREHLPRGGKPPATDEECGLRLFRESELENDSVSEVVNFLPVPLACDRFCKNTSQT